MKIRFNPSGTHTHKDQLKVQLDLYPDVTDKAYTHHYVYVPVVPDGGYTGNVNEFGVPTNQKQYDKWLASLPHIWKLNPCLCMFIRVGQDINKTILTEWIGDTLTPEVLATIDESIIQPNSAHLISPYMRNRGILSTAKTTTFDEQMKADVDTILDGLSIARVVGKAEIVEPESIDIGSPAIARSNWFASNSDTVTKTNPANADGVIDTVQVYVTGAWTGCKTGVYSAAGNVLTCNDSEAVGNTNINSTTTYEGLTIDVATGEYIGFWADSGSGYLQGVGTGYDGNWYHTNEYIDPTDSATFAFYEGDTLSLYGTGTEAGGTDYPITTTCGLSAGVSISRALTWDRTSATALELSASVDRELAWVRTAATGLTSSATVAKSYGWNIASSCAIAVSATISRAATYTRAPATALSAAVSVSKSTGRAVAISAGLAVSTTIIRVAAYTRSISTGLTSSVSIAKSLGRTVSTTTGLAVSATVDRDATYTRDVSPGLAAAVSISRTVGRIITTSTSLVVSATVSRTLAWTRATASGITVSISAIISFLGGSVNYAITIITGLSISSSVSRSVTWGRSATSGITASVSVARSINRTITTATALAVSAIASRSVQWSRSVSVGLTSAVTAVISSTIDYARKRFFHRPSTTYGSDVSKSGRYGARPSTTYGSDVSKSGRYGSPE